MAMRYLVSMREQALSILVLLVVGKELLLVLYRMQRRALAECISQISLIRENNQLSMLYW